MSRRSSGILAVPRRVFPRSVFPVCAFLLALPLAALSILPSAAFAHPALPAAPSVGKSSGPAEDLTLHYHSSLGGLGAFDAPDQMATDPQGNLYISEVGADWVDMYNSSDTFVRHIGTGMPGTDNGDFNDPRGIAANATTVFVADYINAIVDTFNKGTGAYTGQFGSGHLTNPIGMALASNGQLYVADPVNDEVVRFSTAGVFLGQFGGSGSGNGEFNNPVGVAASPLGFIYVADAVNHRVQEFTLAGAYVTQWGSASFKAPTAIAVDRAGMVYVVDQTAQTIYKFDPNGSLVGSYAAPSTTPFVAGTFEVPAGIAVRSIANTPIAVYVSDYGSGDGGIVQRFDLAVDPQLHTYQTAWGSFGNGNGQFSLPTSIAVDSNGNVYVTDSNNNRVEKFDQFGNFLLAFGSPGPSGGQFNFPTGIAVSPPGDPGGTIIYVADSSNNRVEEFNSSGGFIRQFGTPGTGNGQLAGPQALATELGTTLVFVVDSGNNRIQAFDSLGEYVTQFGSFGSGDGQFNNPTGIALDVTRQEMFISDTANNRVEVMTTGGAFVASITSNGVGPFHAPEGIATDQRGDVYVADTDNNLIAELDVNTTRTAGFGTTGMGDGEFEFPYAVTVSPTNGQIYVVDLGDNRIERWGSPWPKNDTVGIYRPSTKAFYLRNENSTGPADIIVHMPYAQAGDLPIVGDWNGDGVDTVGLYRPSTARFLLQDANVEESAPDYSFTLGLAGDTPIAGDWNGDGTSGAGTFRPSNGILYLKNALSTGPADVGMVLGVPGDVGIAGDWNGDGQDSPGVYRPSTQRFYVSNKVTKGTVTADHSATLGLSGDAPFTGDWPFQGFSGIGVFRPSNGVTYEKNTVSTGPADNNFIYGVAGDIPVAGQWVEPNAPFSAPAPHVSLGTRSPSAPHPASRPSAPGHPASSGQPPAATPRRSTPR